MTKGRNFIALAIIAVLAACGGGGGGGSSVPSGGSAVPTQAPAGNLPTSGPITANELISKVSITMAKGTYAASTARKTQSIGAGTVSITFTLLQQDGTPATSTPQNFGLTASSPGCIQNQAGNLVCTLGVAAPVNQTTGTSVDVFLAQTYDASGNLTGSGAVALSIAQNASNAAAIVLNAQVANAMLLLGAYSIGVAEQPGSLVRRGPGVQAARRSAKAQLPTGFSTQVYVIATDSSGNLILNPSSYSAPIYVQQAFVWYDYFQYDPDTTLTAVYSTNDTAGGACTPGATVTANGWYSSLPICSPADQLTIGIASSGGSDPSYQTALFAWTSPSQLVPTPAPSMTPQPLPTPSGNNAIDINVNYPTPTPAPSCTGSCGNLPVNPQ